MLQNVCSAFWQRRALSVSLYKKVIQLHYDEESHFAYSEKSLNKTFTVYGSDFPGNGSRNVHVDTSKEALLDKPPPKETLEVMKASKPGMSSASYSKQVKIT
jgi:hypothetical protein